MIRSIKFAVVLVLAMCIGATGLFAQATDFGPAKPYVVQKGDTATKIAQKHYGKAVLGKLLWEANKNLVAHPNRLTVGDTIYLFPEETLVARKGSVVPPPPEADPVKLYDRGQQLVLAFPKYLGFMADERGLGGSGSVRVKIKRTEVNHYNETSTDIEDLFEVRHVGSLVGTDEHPGYTYRDGSDTAKYAGKTLVSTNDDVFVRFTEDIGRILDSDTYGDNDPYFREFPIYQRISTKRAYVPSGRVDGGKNIASTFRYKGNVTIVARVEGLTPLEPRRSKALKARGSKANQGYEPVSYVGRITYAVDGIELDDDVFLFVPIAPGPERVIEPPFVEPPDSYSSLGN